MIQPLLLHRTASQTLCNACNDEQRTMGILRTAQTYHTYTLNNTNTRMKLAGVEASMCCAYVCTTRPKNKNITHRRRNGSLSPSLSRERYNTNVAYSIIQESLFSQNQNCQPPLYGAFPQHMRDDVPTQLPDDALVKKKKRSTSAQRNTSL